MKKRDVVAVVLPNTPQTLIVFYGCTRIGATVAEHNPLAPAAEIADQLKRHGARVAVVWEKCAETFWSLLPFFHSFGPTFFCCAAVAQAATQVVLPKFDVDLALNADKRRPITFFVGVPPMFEGIEKRAGETGTSLRTIRFGVAGAMPLSTASARR